MFCTINENASCHNIVFQSTSIANGKVRNHPDFISITNNRKSDIIVFPILENKEHLSEEIIFIQTSFFIRKGETVEFSPEFYKNEKIPFPRTIPALKFSFHAVNINADAVTSIESFDINNEELDDLDITEKNTDDNEKINFDDYVVVYRGPYTKKILLEMSDEALKCVFTLTNFDYDKRIKNKEKIINLFLNEKKSIRI